MAKSVIITGCNGGIGSSLVSTFHDAGYNVIGVDKSAVQNDQERLHFIQYDISEFANEPEKLEDFADAVRARSGASAIHLLINNAAVQILGSSQDLKAADFISTMNVNLVAPFLLAQTFLPELKQNRGSIVNIGSVHAQSTKPGFAAYATSKAALHGLTRALAVDLGPEIRVNTIAPAATATKMLKAGFEGNPEAFAALENVHPLKRIAEPSEIARLALFLASAESGFLTGSTLYADGGILSRLHDPA